ncbi:lysozyme inhibitor LprI family protein [Allosphingosinicella deserti]|uniref:Lysozyme inhibitor LprI N-terminal domain-containing protein n=1 Tax=Allosphingosinicella deserti TaxID=2116704 RepID=A0A2P7QUP5_9SPHN|nr:DUF1311 domain-containing protein [Sphingomonas deserti]PSJ41689.1 hypothetical protein C7I55_05155 [Sphingomonas deserti]
MLLRGGGGRAPVCRQRRRGGLPCLRVRSGAVTRTGIRDAQRAWLRYRDAFLAFAKVKFPAVASDSLAAWLTDKRTEMLETPE